MSWPGCKSLPTGWAQADWHNFSLGPPLEMATSARSLLRDMGALASALHRPQTGYYKDMVEEAAALLESLAINHPFLDGNKRVAFAVTSAFLHINGFVIGGSSAEIYQKWMELFDSNTFKYGELQQWLRKVVAGIK